MLKQSIRWRNWVFFTKPSWMVGGSYDIRPAIILRQNEILRRVFWRLYQSEPVAPKIELRHISNYSPQEFASLNLRVAGTHYGYAVLDEIGKE